MQFASSKYLLPDPIHDDSWHVPVLRQRLTHSIGLFFADMMDELGATLDECIPDNQNDTGTFNLSTA